MRSKSEDKTSASLKGSGTRPLPVLRDCTDHCDGIGRRERRGGQKTGGVALPMPQNVSFLIAAPALTVGHKKI